MVATQGRACRGGCRAGWRGVGCRSRVMLEGRVWSLTQGGEDGQVV